MSGAVIYPDLEETLVATPVFAAGVARRWWARQDSNLQPDRYERPALTN